MMTARALALLLTLTACGASAGPTPAGDAGADNEGDAGDRPCPSRHTLVGGRCVSNLDTACGDPPVACPTGQSCAVVGGGGAPEVRCVAN
jgi:hypothetical protein